MKVGDCVVIMKRTWAIGRIVRAGTEAEAVSLGFADGEENGRCYEVESVLWDPCRQWVDEADIKPLRWLLEVGQAARVLALTSRWALADKLGMGAFCEALRIVVKMGLEGVGSE